MEEYWTMVGIFMPLVTAAAVAIFGLIAFLYQKSIERKVKYLSDVQSRYEKYLHSIFDVMADPKSAEKNAKFQQARVSLRLYASRRVLCIANVFENHITDKQRSAQPNAVADEMLAAMRNHVLPRTTLTQSRMSAQELGAVRSFNVN